MEIYSVYDNVYGGYVVFGEGGEAVGFDPEFNERNLTTDKGVVMEILMKYSHSVAIINDLNILPSV